MLDITILSGVFYHRLILFIIMLLDNTTRAGDIASITAIENSSQVQSCSGLEGGCTPQGKQTFPLLIRV